MLTLQELSIYHNKDLQVLVNQLTLNIHQGEKVAIIGEEGCGKSTLLACLANPHAISHFATMSGHIKNTFNQTSYIPQTLTEEQLSQTIAGYLYQNIDYQQFDFAALYQSAKALHFDPNRLEDDKQQLSTLSGGELLKVQLLKAIAWQSDCLLLDEPSSDLDARSITWLIDFMKNSRATIIFISHDEYVLSQVATSIIHLEQIKKRQDTLTTYIKKDYLSYIKQRKDTFQKEERLASKQRQEQKQTLAKLHQSQSAVHHALQTTKDSAAGRLLAKKMKALKSQEKRFEKQARAFSEFPQESDRINLKFHHLTPLPAGKPLLNYHQQKLATGQTVNLTLWGQSRLVITGTNGIGKSLFLKHLYHELRQIPELNVCYMPQRYEEVLDNSQTPLAFLSTYANEEQVRTLLASLQFTKAEIEHPLLSLSGGQKAKLFLCQMVLSKPHVILLDEPSRHFSPLSQEECRQFFKDFTGCLLAVSHDQLLIQSLKADIYQLDEKTLTPVQVSVRKN